jgi:serine/threonine protein kinase/tetratricopeptide (TPR) repeat protein
LIPYTVTGVVQLFLYNRPPRSHPIDATGPLFRPSEGKVLRFRMALRKPPLVESVAAAMGWRAKMNWSAVLTRAKTASPRPAHETPKWGRFELRREIAKGAFGAVHRALDPLLQREVALKVLHDTSDPAAVIEEARTLAAINHPNVVKVLEVHEHDGAIALSMELIEGRTVEQHLERDGAMSSREAALMGIDLCLALEAVHGAHVLHRDIKPHNVIRCAGGDRYVLTDFGGGERARGGGYGSRRTIGTPLYLAPEVLIGHHPATIASDIYSLGVLLYHAVTNDYPVAGKTLEEVEAAHTKGPIPLAKRRADLPSRFARLVDRALDPDPAKRQRSARELKDDLTVALESELAKAAAATFRRDAIPEIPSVAVLPFVNVGPDQDVEHICSGVAWEIITGLGNVPGLRVAPRIASFEPQHSANPDVMNICQELGVDAVLQGQVRKTGDNLRITAQLLSGGDGQQFWAEGFGERMKDLSDVQENIAQRVVRGMKVRLVDLGGKRLTRQHTDNPRAYNFYLRGRHSWGKRYEGGFVDARQQFEKAIEEDAAYPLAHAGLADTYAFTGFYSIGKPRDAFARARLAADRALAADKYLPAAHTSLGLVKLGNDWDFEGAARDFLRAIELDKSQDNVLARVYLSWVYVLLKEDGEAVREAQRAKDTEPNSPLINSGAAHTFFLIGRDYETAMQCCDDALHFDADCLVAIYLKAASLAKRGKLGDAIALMERAAALSRRAPFYLAILGNLYGRAGRVAEAQALLAELGAKAGYVPPHSHAFVYAGLNDLDRAFEWQAKALDDGASPFNYYSPLIDNMQADARHLRHMKQMGLRT